VQTAVIRDASVRLVHDGPRRHQVGPYIFYILTRGGLRRNRRPDAAWAFVYNSRRSACWVRS